MPNGDDKNWIRLCIAVEGFRARYQKWPETALISKGTAEDIKGLFKPLTYEAVLAKLEILEVEGAPRIELVDNTGNRFNYGEEVGFEQEGDARSWFGVTPDAHSHLLCIKLGRETAR